MSTLLISHLNWKKTIPPGLSLRLSDLMLTVLLDALINTTTYR